MNQEGPQPSAFLRCLAQLNVDTWAEVLLPKLRDQGSATAVALTCSTLRDLCYSSVHRLDLIDLVQQGSCDFSTIEECMRTVPHHFSNCKVVALTLDIETMYHIVPYLLPALAKLPKLNTICLEDAGLDRPPLFLCTALNSIRAQLPGLVNLDLYIDCSWKGATAIWKEIGRLTQLTSLYLNFEIQEPCVPAQADIDALSPLTRLQELSISQVGTIQMSQPLSMATVLAGLSDLTALRFDWCLVPAIHSVSSCNKLKYLTLCGPDGQEEELGSEEWDSIACLSRLTCLKLFNATLLTATPEACAALSKLSNLQQLAAWRLCIDFLPALQLCSQLTCIRGVWQSGVDSSAVAIELPSVRELSGVQGVAPFQVFPNLQVVEQAAALPCAVWLSLCKHGTSLRELRVKPCGASGTFTHSLPAAVALEEGALVVRSLSSLRCVEHLSFKVCCNAELIGLVDVASKLLQHRLQHLDVRAACQGQVVGAGALVSQWGKLSGLQQLSLHIRDPSVAVALETHFPEVCLAAMSGIHKVRLCMPNEGSIAAFEATASVFAEAGLPKPLVVEVVYLDIANF